MLDRNVRGIGIALCLLTLFIFLSGCGSLKDDTLLTVNAVITEVDTGKQTITVKDDTDENTLGEECLIDCSSTPMVYCDFATQKVTRISFEELQVNDKVIVSIRSSEMESFRSGAGKIQSRSNNCSCIRKELLDEPLLSTTVFGLRDRTGEHEVGHPAHQR